MDAPTPTDPRLDPAVVALVAGLPDRPLRAVTVEEVETFHRDGVVLLRGVLPEEWVEVVRAPVDRVVGSGEAVDMGPMAGVEEDAPAFSGGVDHWRHHPTFAAFATCSPLVDLVAALLGGTSVHLWEDSVLVKEAGSPMPTHFHTDASYFHLTGDRVCTTWVPLDAATPDSGVVRWVRGSHLEDVSYRPNLFVTDEPIPGTEGEVVPDVLGTPELAARLVTFDVEPGDVTVHHARTLHGAPPNHSDRRRRAVSVRYTGDDVRYLHKPGLPGRPGLDRVVDGDPVGEPWCPQVWPRR
jgi:ectoine hydroxylase-related dioxygenase (phytanoyl-CoA dioxygenase family)